MYALVPYPRRTDRGACQPTFRPVARLQPFQLHGTGQGFLPGCCKAQLRAIGIPGMDAVKVADLFCRHALP